MQGHHHVVRVQHIGYRVVRHVGRIADHIEGHDLVGVGKVAVVGGAGVLQDYPPADRVLREIDDHLVPLRRGSTETGDELRHGHQAPIRGDHRHRIAGVERELPRPRDRRATYPEPVLASLDLHGRPRTTVDKDHVAPQTRLVLEREEQRTVLVEQRVADEQGNVVRPVRNRQRLLQRVREVILRHEAVICVLRGMEHAMVVVPQRPRRLDVRVAVVLELTGMSDVAGVPVELRQRRRAVEVHRRPRLVAECRVNLRQQVAVTNNGLAALLDLDGRAGHGAVVGEEHRLEAGDNFELRGRHRDVVVVSRAVAPERHSHRWRRERRGERLRELARRHPVRQRRLTRNDPRQRQRQGGAGEDASLDHISASQRHGDTASTDLCSNL